MTAYEFSVNEDPFLAGENRSVQRCISVSLLAELLLFYSMMFVPAFFESQIVKLSLMGGYFVQLFIFELVVCCSLGVHTPMGCFNFYALIKSMVGCLWKALLLAVAFLGVFGYRGKSTFGHI